MLECAPLPCRCRLCNGVRLYGHARGNPEVIRGTASSAHEEVSHARNHCRGDGSDRRFLADSLAAEGIGGHLEPRSGASVCLPAGAQVERWNGRTVEGWAHWVNGAGAVVNLGVRPGIRTLDSRAQAAHPRQPLECGTSARPGYRRRCAQTARAHPVFGRRLLWFPW